MKMANTCLPTVVVFLLLRDFGTISANIIENIYSSYDAGQTSQENFNGILGSICPQSVYCAGENWAPNMTYVYSSETVRTARQDLMGLRDMLAGCCQHCSCDADCQVTNNCCIDAEPVVLIGEAESSQRCLRADLDQHRSPEIIKQDTYLYYMVTKCPNVTSNVNITQPCESPNFAFIEEIVPVQSAETGLIYRNKFCAQCNGVETFSSWQVNAYIAKQVFNHFGQEVMQDLDKLYSLVISLRTKASKLIFNPPDDNLEIARRRRCFSSTQFEFSKCERDVDSDATSIAKFLSNACKSRGAVFLQSHISYNNMFCRLCESNEPLLTEKQGGCGSVQSKGPSNMVGMLLVGREATDAGSTDAALKLQVTIEPIANCTCREWYDEKTNSCRQIHCALGHSFVACKCVPVVKEIFGIPVMTVLRLRNVAHTNFGTPEETDVTMAVIQAAQHRIQSTVEASIHTYPFILFRHIHKDEPTYDLLFELTVYQGWDTRDVVKTLFYKLQEGLMVRVKEMTFEMMLAPVGLIPIYEKIEFYKQPVIYDQQIFEGYGENMTLMYVNVYKKITHSLIFEKQIFCNRISISEEELNQINNALRSYQGGYHIDVYVSTDQQSTYICLEDFISVLRPEMSAASSHLWNIGRLNLCLCWLVCRLVQIWGIT